jgi:acyl-CoA dehydrogenase
MADTSGNLLEPIEDIKHPAIDRASQAMAELDDADLEDLVRRTTFPIDLWDHLSSYQLHGLGIPPELGGEEADLLVRMRIAETLANRLGVLAWVWGITNCFGVPIIQDLATDGPDGAAWLREIAQGSCRFALAITEPTSGSDLFGTMSTIVADGRISGIKRYCTGAADADWMLVLAWPGEASGRTGRDAALCAIPTSVDGIAMERIPTPNYSSAMGTYEVTFDAAEAAHVWSGDPVQRVLRRAFTFERLLIPAIAAGAASGAMRRAVVYANERRAFGRPVSSYEGIQHEIAVAAMDLEVARHYAYGMARRWVENQGLGIGADIAKSRAADAAYRLADAAVQLMGGIGYTSWGGIEHVWRDLRMFQIGPVSEQIVRSKVARQIGMKSAP